MTVTLVRPGPGYERIGEGRHSVVFRRPGSPRVVQLFRADCDTLTVAKLNREYDYLQAVFAPSLPRLLPRQRLFTPGPDAPLGHVVIVKEYVEVDQRLSLTNTAPSHLPVATWRQLVTFLRLVRHLLLDTTPHAALGTDASLIPDIIDPPLQNLVVDTNGNLRLLDTNRLISTAGLRRRHHAGQTVRLDRDVIHALLLRRMMFLESRWRGRTRAELARDPVYTRYLTREDITALITASGAAGEPLSP
ncbi:hypothetical protein [Micromonospora sp. NPDC005324]|uniref:hypothetical protein n=1 Tax=Micromonospora sp. NPDC005324 TaxID=3157033 RepID=UPI0033BF5F28